MVVAAKQLLATFRSWLHVSGGGIIKLITDLKTGVLVGATAVGPCCGELRSMIYAFPTFYRGDRTGGGGLWTRVGDGQ